MSKRVTIPLTAALVAQMLFAGAFAVVGDARAEDREPRFVGKVTEAEQGWRDAAWRAQNKVLISGALRYGGSVLAFLSASLMGHYAALDDACEDDCPREEWLAEQVAPPLAGIGMGSVTVGLFWFPVAIKTSVRLPLVPSKRLRRRIFRETLVGATMLLASNTVAIWNIIKEDYGLSEFSWAPLFGGNRLGAFLIAHAQRMRNRTDPRWVPRQARTRQIAFGTGALAGGAALLAAIPVINRKHVTFYCPESTDSTTRLPVCYRRDETRNEYGAALAGAYGGFLAGAGGFSLLMGYTAYRRAWFRARLDKGDAFAAPASQYSSIDAELLRKRANLGGAFGLFAAGTAMAVASGRYLEKETVSDCSYSEGEYVCQSSTKPRSTRAAAIFGVGGGAMLGGSVPFWIRGFRDGKPLRKQRTVRWSITPTFSVNRNGPTASLLARF
ncbi:MAG: hypothetical protein D6761_03760 [Candidatus Dadabacteria bacterium]|nr:MAG: hypothetical protein D6761_03760 [Candidatus Dadabacteria bacterium]